MGRNELFIIAATTTLALMHWLVTNLARAKRA
jgi:hypothetical protein